MKGRSLLFTQLAPWKGLLNMKYEESGEVKARELEKKRGEESQMRRAGWEGIKGRRGEGAKG